MGNRATFNVSFDGAKCFDLILATVEGFLLFVVCFFPTVLFCFDCALQLYVVVFYLIKGVYLTLDILVKKSRLAREKDTQK